MNRPNNTRIRMLVNRNLDKCIFIVAIRKKLIHRSTKTSFEMVTAEQCKIGSSLVENSSSLAEKTPKELEY